ncbi:MAG TPA: RNA polymerase sigma factor [Terriglobales bacterium]|nr:RNA polymerase sigma factor [Terriglobales bacterium]
MSQQRKYLAASDEASDLKQERARPLSDQEIIRKAQTGDVESLATIFDTHRRRVFNLCFRMLRDRSDAEDLTQDVFVQVFRKIHTFRGQSAFSTWLHRLAVNMVLMEIRSRKTQRYSLIPLESKSDEDDSFHEQFGREDADLRASLDRITIEDALSELPPGYRLVFLLHDVHGYEHQEIAEILSCSIGNCKSQLHKARLKLRRMIRNANRELAEAA